MSRYLFVMRLLPLAMLAAASLVQAQVPEGAAPSQQVLDKALCKAVKRGEIEEVKRLLGGGADANAQCGRRSGEALLSALHRYRVDIVKLLLDSGANITPDVLYGAIIRTNPTYYSKNPATLPILKLLLDYGADVEAPFPRRGDAPSFIAFADMSVPRAAEALRTAAKTPPEVRRARTLRRRARETALASLADKLPVIEAQERSGDEAKNAGKPQEALERFLTALKDTPLGTDKEHELREKVIRTALSIKPSPAVPEESKLHAERAQAFLKRAEGVEGYERAVSELEKASALAPWWAPVYFNLGLVREKAGDLEGAARSLKLYLLAAPGASDAEVVRRKIVDLEVAKELTEPQSSGTSETTPGSEERRSQR